MIEIKAALKIILMAVSMITFIALFCAIVYGCVVNGLSFE